MEFRDSPREAEFRTIVRTFLDSEYPSEYAARPTEWGLFNGAGRAQAGFQQFMKGWTAKLNEHGWGAPAWPKEHGGGGLRLGLGLRPRLAGLAQTDDGHGVL